MPKRTKKPVDRVKAYVDGVGEGAIPAPVFVKRSVERWHDAAKRWQCNETAYNRVVRMMEDMSCPEGISDKFEFWGWQCYFLSWMFLFYTHPDEEEDRKSRKAIRELFLAVPRKAGKSSMLAAASMAFIAEPWGGLKKPVVIYFGTSEETARITFEKTYDIIKADQESKGDTFCKRYGIRETLTNVKCLRTNGLIRPLTAGARNLEGFTAEMVVADEISRLEDIQKMNVLRSGFAAAFSPQFVMTSTPSDLPYSAYDVELERAMRWLGMKLNGSDNEEGPEDNLRYAAVVYAATEDDDPSSEEVWERTQPSYREMKMKTEYRETWRRAQHDERSLHSFKTRQLCVPARIAGDWITLEDWQSTPNPPPKPERGDGWWTFVGMDLSDVRDMTALCILQVNVEGNEQRMWFECFYPRGSMPTSLERAENQGANIENDALIWEKQGWLEVHEGKVIDHERVAQRLVEINRDLNPLSYWSDGYSALEEVKWNVSEQVKSKLHVFKKSPTMHVVPITLFSTWVLNKTIAVQDNPVAERHFRNSVLMVNRYGGRMLEKPIHTSSSKIDIMDALMSAIGGWVQSQDHKLLGKDVAPHPSTPPSLDYGFKVL